MLYQSLERDEVDDIQFASLVRCSESLTDELSLLLFSERVPEVGHVVLITVTNATYLICLHVHSDHLLVLIPRQLSLY